jgi:alkaline phosphatase D
MIPSRMPTVARRSILLTGFAGSAAASLSSATFSTPTASAPTGLARLAATTSTAARPQLKIPRDPFTLGVASGDPTPDGVVLWTRLAPEPLENDGLGGMPPRGLPVDWQVAEDRHFSRPVLRGSVLAVPSSAHTVHVEVTGLRPGREYWYRFRAGGHLSPVGHTRTAPPYGSSPRGVDVAVASCAEFEHGFFTAYRRLAEEEPDLVLHLGDYLYEMRRDRYVADAGNVRDHLGPETVTLANYRQRHAQYKTDPDLQFAHAAAPWSVVFDDHEVDANWAGFTPEHHERDLRRRRAAAFRAYYEHMPLHRTSLPRGPTMQIYRRLPWGDLATFHLLDTRQYRDNQACGDGLREQCGKRLDRGRTILGTQQERWLTAGLGASVARWDVLAQQVFFARKDCAYGPAERLAMDAWDGYPAARRRVVDALTQRQVRNPVLLTGDVHSHFANDLYRDFDDPGRHPVGVELVTTSVTSGGDGGDERPATDVQLAENPHIRFTNSQRGYVMTRYRRDHLLADFRVLPYVSRPGARASTRASFVVEDRRPGLTPA